MKANEPVAWIDPNKKLPKDKELVSVLALRGEDDPTDIGNLYPARYNLKDKSFESCGVWFEQYEIKGWLPLTHPAKTLTYDEMEIIAEALLMIGLQDYFINYDFKEKALAILRKAQENG